MSAVVVFPFHRRIQFSPQSSFNQSQLKHNHFFPVTPKQIERLYSRFTSLDRSDCGTLSREDFLRIPELAINPLCDRIVHSFIADSNDDRVNFRQFMQVLARFRTIKKGKENKLNNREEKLRCKLRATLCIKQVN
jgi:Ca2+-binding EF-hand superfamily protein